MREKIAAGFLALICLISIYQPLDLKLLRVSSKNEDLIVLEKARCITDTLPKGVHQFGSLPPVNLIFHDQESVLENGDQLRRLFMMRHVLTPDLILENPDGAAWVIGYFENHETGLQYLQNETYSVVKDCENGVFLLKR